MMPVSVNPSSRLNQNDINDTGFLPDWMYYYPDFIHKGHLDINVQEDVKELDSIMNLESAVVTWKKSGSFNRRYAWAIPFEPGVIDSGIKKRIAAGDSSDGRQIDIRRYYKGNDFWERLCEPRSPEKAKKRLIEVSSHDRESVLICWLTSTKTEKPLFMEFFRRHELSESFFGERASWLGNIWDTELHLGFYQLLNDRDHDRYTRFKTSEDQLPNQQVANASVTFHGREIVPVAISFRFVGDLRDRFWTCHFLSSVTHGYKNLIEEYYTSTKTPHVVYSEKQGQRKLLELVYIERGLNEMRRSIDGILAAFKAELEAPETQGEQEEDFELFHDQSSYPLKAGAKLGDILQQLNSSISVIEQWEKREDTRGFRSRWSQKDQDRHGERLSTLALKCRSNLQQLRAQQSRLREQRRIAEQRHNNLLGYKQLQEARTSTRSAEDVRLFTYVTIIFLPLSFSSSLFSMAGAPQGSTIYVMVPTTVIALVVTFLILANLKLMDRHWSSWMNKLDAYTQKHMQATDQSSRWSTISKELKASNQRRLVKQEIGKRLPAESKWYYFFFWLTFGFKTPKNLVRKGIQAKQAYDEQSINRLLLSTRLSAAVIFVPVSALIFLVHEVLVTIADVLHLTWVVTRLLATKISSPPTSPPAEQTTVEETTDTSKSTSSETSDDQSSIDSASRNENAAAAGSVRTFVMAFLRRLESPPRPVRDYIGKLSSEAKETQEQDSAEDSTDGEGERNQAQPNFSFTSWLINAVKFEKLCPRFMTSPDSIKDGRGKPKDGNIETIGEV